MPPPATIRPLSMILNSLATRFAKGSLCSTSNKVRFTVQAQNNIADLVNDLGGNAQLIFEKAMLIYLRYLHLASRPVGLLSPAPASPPSQ